MEDKDVFLQFIRDLAVSHEKGKVEIHLFVGGSILSGTLISAKKYFSEIADMLSVEFWPHDPQQTIVDKTEEFKQRFMRMGESALNRKHIHLLGVRVKHGSSESYMNLWRGHIDNVDGFSFELESELSE